MKTTGWALAAITLIVVHLRPLSHLGEWLAMWWKPITGLIVFAIGLPIVQWATEEP